MPFTLYVNYTDHSGTFHYSVCPHSTERKMDDAENGAWFDGPQSEVLAKGVLEFIRRTKNYSSAYLFLRCQDCNPVRGAQDL